MRDLRIRKLRSTLALVTPKGSEPKNRSPLRPLEFLVLAVLEDEPLHGYGMVQRIESRTEAWSNSNGLPMAVSLGVSHAPRDGQDLKTLLSVADIHLYQSKSQQADMAAEPASNYRTLFDEPKAS